MSTIYLLIAFALTMIGLSLWGRRTNTSHSIEEFLVSNREVSTLKGAFSIAVSWVWAPAIFIAGLQAYTKGLPGAFWFIVPNILCFFLFSFVATRLRAKFPDGFTFPQYIQNRYKSKPTHYAFLVIFFGYQIGAIVINSVAGGVLLNLLTGMSFSLATIALSATALTYSVIGGMRASIKTDQLQMMIILVLAVILVPWVITEAGGFTAVTNGFGGITGEFKNIFDPHLAWVFGIPLTISLLAGPIGDQQFFQRAFSVKKTAVKRTFIIGGLIFGLVPIILSLLGFVAANPEFGITVTDPQMVAPAVIEYFLPNWALLLFTLMAFAGLSSTMDSAYCAVSSFIIADMTGQSETATKKIKRARLGMFILALLGTGIALLKPELLWVFFIDGALVAVGFFPTLFVIFNKNYSAKVAFWSIILGFILSVPLSIYANISGNENLIVIASILSITIGLVVSLGFILKTRLKTGL
jgi:Na+/proline symporter